MSIVLGLLAAAAFGAGDFFAGLASRRLRPALVTTASQFLGLAPAIAGVLLFPGDGPTGKALVWGAVAGLGSGSGALALYYGMTVGRMSVVATLSGLLAAVIPVLVGLIGGDSLSVASAAGIAIAIPAIGLVSWHPGTDEAASETGAIWGVLAGVGFALLFIALDRAGTDSGAWPIVANQVSSIGVTGPLAALALIGGRVVVSRKGVLLTIAAGTLIGLANVAFLAATHTGELAIVVVLTALYPGVTAILARLLLDEHWTRSQKVGLITAFAAVVLVSAGST
jgi:drug/metabolite transporter (DMT)-like permease